MKLKLFVTLAFVLSMALNFANAAPSLTRSTVADEFRAGVLGFAWGSNIDDVLQNFPPGVAWPLNSPGAIPIGERYFAVPDDTPILGVKRSKQQTMFGFDYSSRLIHAIFSIPYAAKGELLENARSQFGPRERFRVEGRQSRHTWGPVDGIAMMIIDIPDKSRPSLFVMVVRTIK